MRATLTVRRSPGGNLHTHSAVRLERTGVYELTFELPIDSYGSFTADLERFIVEDAPTCRLDGWTVVSIHDISWELAKRFSDWVDAWLKQSQDVSAH